MSLNQIDYMIRMIEHQIDKDSSQRQTKKTYYKD